MKSILVFFLSLIFFSSVQAQKNKLSNLPSGRYEAVLKQTNKKWKQGDIIILDGIRYKTTSNDEIGEYKFSATAQRIFFLSGPLKTVYAKTQFNGNEPSIVLPFTENSRQGVHMIASDVLATLKKVPEQ